MSTKAENVGILAMEIYVPSTYVNQTELEKFDGVSQGKYTIGLGQSKMGFCSDREDINSLCLTVLKKLIEKNNIDLHDVGRLEVGTETIIDKSKSVKTCLMTLFVEAGATDIEGIDTTNACYGGTAALLNAVNWVESKSWDGRKAIVVAGDIAVYEKGPARPTGGAGVVAMLVGPDAPLYFDSIRASYMSHAYDFYKPDLASEFPYVDGKLSIKCYLTALDNCYNLYCKKMRKIYPNFKGLMSLDAMLFHSPYCKLVQKSLARVSFNDFLNAVPEEREKQFPNLSQFNNATRENSYFDRDVEKSFMTYSEKIFAEKTNPSLHIPRIVGNMYTSSLYGSLTSYLVSKNPTELIGRKFALFSYGSGLASTMFSINIDKDLSKGSKLTKLLKSLNDNVALLEKRRAVDPKDFSAVMEVKTKHYRTAPYTPTGSIDTLFPGTYYLASIDDQRRRFYDRKPLDD